MSTESNSQPSVLTIAKLRSLQEAIRSFVKVHPSDAGRPILANLQQAGYEIEMSEYLPSGIGFVHNVSDVGIIYFDSGKAFLWKNTILGETPGVLPKSFIEKYDPHWWKGKP